MKFQHLVQEFVSQDGEKYHIIYRIDEQSGEMYRRTISIYEPQKTNGVQQMPNFIGSDWEPV